MNVLEPHKPKGFALLVSDEEGGIMMEYIVLNLTIFASFFLGTALLFNPAGAVFGDYGLLGQAFVDWYQRIVIGISLPIP